MKQCNYTGNAKEFPSAHFRQRFKQLTGITWWDFCDLHYPEVQDYGDAADKVSQYKNFIITYSSADPCICVYKLKKGETWFSHLEKLQHEINKKP